MTRQDVNQALLQTAFLYGANSAYIEALQAKYEKDPLSVEPGWRDFFAALGDDPASVEKTADGASWRKPNWPQTPKGDLINALDGDWPATERAVAEKLRAKAAEAAPAAPASEDEIRRATRDSVRALMMIRAYRMRGHLHANLDPLGLEPQKDHEELHPATYGFHEADYDRKIFIDHVLGLEYATVREMLAILRRTYCGTIGFEFLHISDPAEKSWIQERVEGPHKEIQFTKEGKRAILSKLVESEGFENFFDIKYPGAKRFGLDGGEAMIPALEQIIKRGGQLGLREICLGMAHRGRLNVLSQVMGKPHRVIFHEFKGGSASPDEVEGSGDVKYHLGASSDREFDGNNVHLSLSANPSHLEIVDPIVLGKARAKQDQLNDFIERSKVLPLLIHGDAAFAGQGVVAESFGLSGLRGHRTGGSLHFIINNQIGFTTYPRYSRSSPYPSDVAKLVEAPIFHVNGDDPEAVVFCAKVATEYRQKFHKPVVIDMFCYRRFGHNEGDEPSFTQPIMYRLIRSHPTTLQIYAEKLIGEGIVTQGEVDKMKADWRNRLEAEYEAGQAYSPNKADWLDGKWAGVKAEQDVADDDRRGQTGVDIERLKQIGERITAAPAGFNIHKTILRFLDNRRNAIVSGEGIDWATAEALAFGSLLDEGFPVRLSGQDSRARHILAAPLGADRSGHRSALHPAQPHPRRPVAVRGHQLDALGRGGAGLRIWIFARRAERARHVGGAIRRFRQRRAGRVRPVHFVRRAQVAAHVGPRLPPAARLRGTGAGAFLGPARALPAALRRGQHAGGQLHDAGQPLPRSATPAEAPVPQAADHDDAEVDAAQQTRGVAARPLRSGQVLPSHPARPRRVGEEREDEARPRRQDPPRRHFDRQGLLGPLRRAREARRRRRLPPARRTALSVPAQGRWCGILSRFKKAEVVWCQEEPKNMGAWFFVEPYIEWVLGQVGGKSRRARFAGRPAAASPATGLMSKHLAQLKAFLDECLS